MSLHDDTIYALVHSPLVGGLTWQLVAHDLQGRGLNVIVPLLTDQAEPTEPFWKQQVASVSQALIQIPSSQAVILVGHSGGGPLLPAIGQALTNPVTAYVFVDAGVPRDGASRLDLMKSEDPEWAEQFHQELLQGQKYPSWGEDDLREIVPDDDLRRKLVTEINPHPLSFFTEPIPVFEGWPDAPCAYIKFSAPYDRVTEQAQQAGWLVRQMAAGHFHMLVKPRAVTDVIIASVEELRRREAN